MALRSMNTCPSCGGSNLTEKPHTETLTYGHAPRVPVELSVEVPLLHCEGCGEEWTDYRGEDARTLAVFKHEKSIGAFRNYFVDDHEKSLWEQA